MTAVFLTKIAEEVGRHLVRGHVDEASAKTEVWENQQHLLHDVIDVSDFLHDIEKKRDSEQIEKLQHNIDTADPWISRAGADNVLCPEKQG